MRKRNLFLQTEIIKREHSYILYFFLKIARTSRYSSVVRIKKSDRQTGEHTPKIYCPKPGGSSFEDNKRN